MALFGLSVRLIRTAACGERSALLMPGTAQRVLAAGISSKVIREGKPSTRPSPFPYREKKYTLLRSLLDRTTSRFDENSKIIVVEGPVASGKAQAAKRLAQELDMHYIPDANMDTVYINRAGYDMRQLDDRLPESVRSFDEEDFCREPNHTNAANFQIWMYRLRFSLYIDALAHVLSTGQGVVIQRCPWSDFVFLEAMFSQGYISKGARNAYYTVKDNTIEQLMRPHLVVYLDVPVDSVMKNIKTKGEPFEANSKALTKNYIQDIETNYKEKYLREIGSHAELLMYNWDEEGDVEAVVEDICRIDFDCYTKHDTKLKDWRKPKEQAWADTRMLYADQKSHLMSLFNIPVMDVPELVALGEDIQTYNAVWLSAPGMEPTSEGMDKKPYIAF